MRANLVISFLKWMGLCAGLVFWAAVSQAIPNACWTTFKSQGAEVSTSTRPQSALQTVKLPEDRRSLIVPEISKTYEADLTTLLMKGRITQRRLLREGRGITESAMIGPFDVILKRYAKYSEYKQKVMTATDVHDPQALRQFRKIERQLENEKTTWKVSSSLGFDVFPFGVLREIQGELTWVQLKVNGVSIDSMFKPDLPPDVLDRNNRLYEEISESRWGVREQMLAYLIGDADHNARQSLYDLDGRRVYYLDAGDAFEIGLDPQARASRSPFLVEPFMMSGLRLTRQNILIDHEFFRHLIHVDPAQFSLSLGGALTETDRIDLELRLRRLQDEVRVFIRD